MLAQLGNRVQHALRAFTPDDADALRKTARTFPMTELYDVEQTITSLGIGEALVTVLSPQRRADAARRDAPPAARLLMAPLDRRPIRRPDRREPAPAKYATTVDRESAHEMISARIAAARAAAADAPPRRPPRRVNPTTAGGLNTMTPAQQQREIARQAREMAAAQRPPSAERAAQAESRRPRRPREAPRRTVDTAIRTGGKVITSTAGQDIIRGVFGTLFGKG